VYVFLLQEQQPENRQMSVNMMGYEFDGYVQHAVAVQCNMAVIWRLQRSLKLLAGFQYRRFVCKVRKDVCMLTFEDIMFFSTGVKHIPPLGFTPSPSIKFLHDSEGDGQRSSFPKANTCSCCLQLPVVHATFNAFVEAMVFGIRNSQGFGYANFSC